MIVFDDVTKRYADGTVAVNRLSLTAPTGKLTVLVTDGLLPHPYGRELTGYEVTDLQGVLAKAKAAGVTTLVEPYTSDGRTAAMLQFPGGYIAEVHATAPK